MDLIPSLDRLSCVRDVGSDVAFGRHVDGDETAIEKWFEKLRQRSSLPKKSSLLPRERKY